MLKFSKTIINPFDYINPETVRNTVNTLKDLHPEWEKEDICRELIAKKARLCGGSGALAALPSSIPGLGTLVTVIGGTAVDITFLVYFLSELTLEISTVYNRNPSTDATVKEALWVLSSCFGLESTTVGISKVAVINTSKKALAVLIEKLFTIIGGWLSKRIILKMLPIVGSFINASINMSACKHAGKEIVLWYKTNLEQDNSWSKGTEQEDTEDFFEDEEPSEEKERDIPEENIIFEPMDKEEAAKYDVEEDIIDIPVEDVVVETVEELQEEQEEIRLKETDITESSVKEDIQPEKQKEEDVVFHKERELIQDDIAAETGEKFEKDTKQFKKKKK